MPLTRKPLDNNNNNNGGDDSETTTTDRSSTEGHDLSPQLDEILMTLDDDIGDFDPNKHWVSCRGRFCYEINPCQNWFLVEDPPFTRRTLDIPASFAPTGPCPILGKSMSLASTVAVFVVSLLREKNKLFFLAYFHTWNLIYSIIYLYCSLLNTLLGVPQPYSRVRGSVKACWFMFIVAAQAGVLEAIVYWTTEFDRDNPSYDFRTVMLHGGVALEVILDGFTVNFIPLRWMHWWGCCLLPNIVYVGWTLIHGFFLYTGNPNEPDRNSIYEFLEWRYEWKRTLLYVCLALFVISPFIFLLLWMMSLYKWCCCCCFCWRRERRRYLERTRNMEKYRQAALEKAQQEQQQRQEMDLEDSESMESLGDNYRRRKTVSSSK